MSLSRLDAYFPKEYHQKKTDKEEARRAEEEADEEAPKNLPPSYFISATYDGNTKKACIKLYEPKSKRIYKWYDNTGHKPYCRQTSPQRN